MSLPQPVAPGGMLGILGGGQLGRMLALSAAAHSSSSDASHRP